VHYKQAMKLKRTLLHAGVLILLSTTAFASERGRAIYESQCVACHGNPGLALKTPLLHGQERAYLIRSLQAFQLGGRIDQIMSSMNGIAAGLSDADISAVASYLAGQDACDVKIEVDFNREGFREEFTAGKDKYMQANCSHCHDSFHHYAPRIVGQKAEYLRLALSQFKAGVRVAPMMATILGSWTDDDFENVVTYLSGLRLMRACDG